MASNVAFDNEDEKENTASHVVKCVKDLMKLSRHDFNVFQNDIRYGSTQSEESRNDLKGHTEILSVDLPIKPLPEAFLFTG